MPPLPNSPSTRYGPSRAASCGGTVSGTDCLTFLLDRSSLDPGAEDMAGDLLGIHPSYVISTDEAEATNTERGEARSRRATRAGPGVRGALPERPSERRRRGSASLARWPRHQRDRRLRPAQRVRPTRLHTIPPAHLPSRRQPPCATPSLSSRTTTVPSPAATPSCSASRSPACQKAPSPSSAAPSTSSPTTSLPG